MDSRTLEHSHSQDKDIARRSSVPKKQPTPAITHGMHERTNTTLGAPPHPNYGPDASSALPTDPSRQGKEFPIPAASWGMKGGDGQDVDRTAAHRVMAAAPRSSADFARDLHTELPETTTEN